MATPYSDESGYDHVSQIHYCTSCNDPIEIRGHVVKDHTMCVWRHYAYISFPEILATDEKGFTMEGVIAQPARKILAPIPVQTRVQYCLPCWPHDPKEGCLACGEYVDLNQEHSEVTCLDKLKNETNLNFKIGYFHFECLPAVFSKVRDYREQYG